MAANALPIASLLLDAGADPNLASTDELHGFTVLTGAIGGGQNAVLLCVLPEVAAKSIQELSLPQTCPKQALADAVEWFRANGYVREKRRKD